MIWGVNRQPGVFCVFFLFISFICWLSPHHWGLTKNSHIREPQSMSEMSKSCQGWLGLRNDKNHCRLITRTHSALLPSSTHTLRIRQNQSREIKLLKKESARELILCVIPSHMHASGREKREERKEEENGCHLCEASVDDCFTRPRLTARMSI